MQLLFLRHTHSTSQEDKTIVVGRAYDEPLTPLGRRQAETAATALAGRGIRAAITSTCARARQTAEIIARRIDAPLDATELLVERSQGEFEGRKKDEVYTPDIIALMHADQLRWRPPGGESLEDVQHRLNRFARTLGDGPGPLLLVTHLMLLWALFHLATRCDHAILPTLRVDNGALVEVDWTPPDTWRILRWNAPLLTPGEETP